MQGRNAPREGDWRGNALWGQSSSSKGKNRSGSFGRRGAAVLLALVAALVMAVSATASTKSTGLPYTSTASYPTGSYLAQVQANPKATYRVIVQVQTKGLQSAVANWTVAYGNTHKFNLIKGVSLKIPGWAILYVNEHPKLFGNVRITPDQVLKPSDVIAPDNGSEMAWQKAVQAAPLWSHPAVPCPLNVLGLKVDPNCQDVAARTAPQAPAIAIVDTGIDASKSQDFGSRIETSVNFSSLSPGATGDQMGHGTMVAGIAAGSSSFSPGVAQNAPLVDVRTGDSQGQSLTSDVISALDWIDQHKAQYNIRVVNMSMAGNQATSFRTDPLDKAVEALWLDGVTVVAAAGNNGNADGTPSPLGAPANDPFVITVGATTPLDDTRAPWSAFGKTVDGFEKPELSAPGRYMVAPVPAGSTLANAEPGRIVRPGYMWMSGTSFAAPQVAGAAAQILALHPSWTPDQVKGALMATAVKTADGLGTGVGELNAVAAAVAVATPPNPNLHLNDFVSADPSTGVKSFNADSWASYAKANSDWSVSDWSASDWSVSDWSVSDWSVSDWSVSDWSVSDWSVSDWSVSDWSVSDWSVSDNAASDWSVSDWSVGETSP
jgi:serine protease AprX